MRISARKIITNARNRLQNAGNGLVESWAKWREMVDEAAITRTFLKVGNVRSQEAYDKLLGKYPILHDADKLWIFVWSQLNKGEATWVATRRIMDVITRCVWVGWCVGVFKHFRSAAFLSTMTNDDQT